MRSTRAVRLLASALLVGILLCASPAVGGEPPAVLEVTETSAWRPPSPDPMGLAYLRRTGELVVSDSEVDEMAVFGGGTVFFAGLDGRLASAVDMTTITSEPADVATGRRGRVLVFVDDDQNRVVFVRRGRDRRWGSADDRVRSFRTAPFGSRDPEGLGRGGGKLFLTDGRDARVYVIGPGGNGRFDGVPPEGDDRVTSFGTVPLGMRDPEDVAYDRATGYLWLISRRDRSIAVATQTGELVTLIDISASGILRPSGIVLVPSTDDASTLRVFVADRGLDNDRHPAENDGRLFEFAVARETAPG